MPKDPDPFLFRDDAMRKLWKDAQRDLLCQKVMCATGLNALLVFENREIQQALPELYKFLNQLDERGAMEYLRSGYLRVLRIRGAMREYQVTYGNPSATDTAIVDLNHDKFIGYLDRLIPLLARLAPKAPQENPLLTGTPIVRNAPRTQAAITREAQQLCYKIAYAIRFYTLYGRLGFLGAKFSTAAENSSGMMASFFSAFNRIVAPNLLNDSALPIQEIALRICAGFVIQYDEQGLHRYLRPPLLDRIRQWFDLDTYGMRFDVFGVAAQSPRMPRQHSTRRGPISQLPCLPVIAPRFPLVNASAVVQSGDAVVQVLAMDSNGVQVKNQLGDESDTDGIQVEDHPTAVNARHPNSRLDVEHNTESDTDSDTSADYQDAVEQQSDADSDTSADNQDAVEQFSNTDDHRQGHINAGNQRALFPVRPSKQKKVRFQVSECDVIPPRPNATLPTRK